MKPIIRSRNMDIPCYKYKPLNALNEIRVLELRITKLRIEIRIFYIPVLIGSFEALLYV